MLSMYSHLLSTKFLRLTKSLTCSFKLSRSTTLTWTLREASRPINLSGVSPQHHLSWKLWKQTLSRMTTLPGKRILISCIMLAAGLCLYAGTCRMKTLKHSLTKSTVSFSEAEAHLWLTRRLGNRLSSIRARSVFGTTWSVKKMKKASTSLSLPYAKASN